MTETGSDALQRPFVISRTFSAPRELIWEAWTERQRLMRWFGPKGFTMSAASMDFRPGGMFHYCLLAPDGRSMWGKFLYREIVVPERITMVNCFSDENGGTTRHPKSPTWPLEMLSICSLVEQGGDTTVTIQWAPLNPTAEERRTFDAAHEDMKRGWSGTFDQLADYLARGHDAGTHKITPFLWFDNQAAEAAEFYVSIFKNSKIVSVNRYGEAGPGPKGSVMTVVFDLDGQRFIALNGGPHFKFTEAISFSVDCKTQEEVDEFWEKLGKGGQPGQCGWLKDKYGLPWQIVPTILSELLGDPDPAKAQRVTEAMLKMRKINIRTLQEAYGGFGVYQAAA